MDSSTTLQDIVQTARITTEVYPPDFELLRRRIFDISMNAFLSDVLTLERMCSVIAAVEAGVADNTAASLRVAGDTMEMARRAAYQGLCGAAGQALVAAGLAFPQFLKFHGSRLPAEIGKVLARETLALKQQVDLITCCADWLSNSNVTRLQAHGFGRIFQTIDTYTKQADEPAISWSDRFFQNSGYKPLQARSNANASLMLLGLLTSGALISLQDTQPAM